MDASVSTITVLKDFLPLVGVLVGAGLQYFFSRSTELKRHERTLRVEAYSDYLRSVGEAETGKGYSDAAKRSEIMGRAISAKARVCVHGSATVVAALAKFEDDPTPGLTPQKKKYFLDFVEAIRNDIGADGNLSSDAVEHILFGKTA